VPCSSSPCGGRGEIAAWAAPWRSINRGPAHVEHLGEKVALSTALRLLVRVHANQTIDLHLGELPAAAVQRFEAQRGTYRVSGGRIEIHPQMGAEPVNFILDHIVDQKPGATVSPPTVRSRSWCEMMAPISRTSRLSDDVRPVTLRETSPMRIARNGCSSPAPATCAAPLPPRPSSAAVRR
jgi:hypothetical protein